MTLRDMTPEMCKEQCEKDETFNCMSFDYLHSSYICYLKVGSRYGAKLSTSASYAYYEWNCLGEFTFIIYLTLG